ncbi:MFS transporter [Streptomyces sp. SCL15-6]|uniref:MFS transporter n=1 Tax=Streptomyces sp. SCL15-6 TaxID=2967222 RepID=UPI0029663E94|nr:MFS transporter [Streptomyces sp. SCL15-6]
MTGTAAHPAGTAARSGQDRDGRNRVVLLILSANMILDAIEVSVVLVALPTIRAQLGLSAEAVQWLMSGFALGFALLLILGTRLVARLGTRRLYLAAMLGFAAASLAGGFTDEPALLVATRVLKGACAALTAPAGLALIATAFPDGPRRRRAVSVYSLCGAAGFTAGLLLSGALLRASWRWTLWFPAPLALILLLLALRRLPDVSRAPGAGRPVLRLLREGTLLRTAVGAATLNGTYHSLLFLLTFHLQERLHWSPWQNALALLPACLPLAVTVPFAGRMTARYGTARLITLGAAAPLVGYVLLLARPAPTSYVTGILPTLLLVGAGFVLSFAALNLRAASSAADEDRPAAVRAYQAAVQLGAVPMLPLTAWLLGAGHGQRPALALITAVAAVGLTAALSTASASDGKAPA